MNMPNLPGKATHFAPLGKATACGRVGVSYSSEVAADVDCRQCRASMWQMREAMTLEGGPLYTISRIVNRKRVHLEHASDGRPMLWGEASARAAVAKANGAST